MKQGNSQNTWRPPDRQCVEPCFEPIVYVMRVVAQERCNWDQLFGATVVPARGAVLKSKEETVQASFVQLVLKNVLRPLDQRRGPPKSSVERSCDPPRRT